MEVTNKFWVVAYTKSAISPYNKKGEINNTAFFNAFRKDDVLISKRKPRYLKSIDQYDADGETAVVRLKTLKMLGINKEIEDFFEPKKVKISLSIEDL